MEANGRPKPAQDAKGRFVAGNSGNGGRPKGSRNKLGEDFVEALQDEFARSGATAIRTLAATDPGGFVRVIAGILPKEVKDVTERELTGAELDARIHELLTALGYAGGTGPAAIGATPGTSAAKPH